MNRRQLLQGATATLMASLAGETLVGTATAGGLRADSVDEATFPDLLSRLDAQVASLRASTPHAAVQAFYRSAGLPGDFSARAAATLLVVGTFRDLPHHLQAHPEMQRRIRLELPRFGQQALAMARALRDIPDEQRRKIRRVLQKNPELAPALRAHRRQKLAASGAPPERIAQVDAMNERIYFRLGRQDPGFFLDDLVERVRRAGRGAGVEEADWEHLLAEDLEADPGEALLGEEVLGEGVLGEGVLTTAVAEEGDGPTPLPSYLGGGGDSRGRHLIRVGMIVAGIGVGAFLLGMGAGAIGFDVGLLLGTLGALTVIAGLVVILVGLVVYAAEEMPGASDADGVLPPAFLARIRGGALPLAVAA